MALRGKVCCAEDRFGRGCSGDRFRRGCSGDRFGRVYRGKIRQLDLTIVNYCIVKYICAGINAASQEVLSTCNNRSVCCDVTIIHMLVSMPHLRRCSPGLGESRINDIIKCYCVLL